MLDIKSTAIGALTSLAFFGGLYGLYAKHASATALSESKAYEMLIDCTRFKSNKGSAAIHKDEVTALLASIRISEPAVSRGDAVVRIVSTAQGTAQTSTGMAGQLKECAVQLERSLSEIAQPGS
jgi:hypothetical protein